MENSRLLNQQYEMVTGSRRVMLDFIKERLSQHLHTPVPAFNSKSLAYLLVHNALVYHHWLANFAMQRNLPYHNADSFESVEAISGLYKTVDKVVNDFLERYNAQLDNPVNGVTASGMAAKVTPLQLFTHVFTHEFHHKGQLLSMCRLLGQVPPDTDVIRF
jgi:uncharacterized damage-inducible protein DinB